jgi:CDP-glucose 4,6-dehydratase
MAEIATAAYRKSYFQNGQVRIASARAGNVIGGGDWAEDRIVPDAMRALDNKESISVRNPRAVRPWQHVLEPLSGYLTLAASLAGSASFATAFNFGPGPDSNRTVSDLIMEILKHRKAEWTDASDPAALHEATLLNLSIDKAFRLLDWKPKWAFEETISKTVAWYTQVHAGTVSPLEITQSQIAEYKDLQR